MNFYRVRKLVYRYILRNVLDGSDIEHAHVPHVYSIFTRSIWAYQGPALEGPALPRVQTVESN